MRHGIASCTDFSAVDNPLHRWMLTVRALGRSLCLNQQIDIYKDLNKKVYLILNLRSEAKLQFKTNVIPYKLKDNEVVVVRRCMYYSLGQMKMKEMKIDGEDEK